MSIIQDALKKVQGYTKAEKASLGSSPKERKYNPKLPATLLVLFIILIGFVTIRFLAGEKIGGTSKGEAGLRLDAASRQEVTYKPLSPEKQEIPFAQANRRYPSLILSGIMYLEDGPRAIINDSVVKEGDTVNGAIVKNIGKKSVLFEFNGSEIKIELK